MSDHLDLLTPEGRLFDAARQGDVITLTALLDEEPARIEARDKPYAWSLLHHAAQHGHLPAVNLLLGRGLSPNTLESGDNTSPMHWAAAAGHPQVVRRLADAGGDVIGHGDDHELEVIGWTTCWYGCDDAAHRAIAEFLVGRGARHHIFSAVAMNLADEVRRIVAYDPGALARRMSRNEDHQLPLHFAVRMNRPGMVTLLVELGADPLGVDQSGNTAAVYATSPEIDRPVMEAIRDMTRTELRSAERGKRTPDAREADVIALLALGEWETAAELTRESPRLIRSSGVLHLMAKRGDPAAVKWLLDHGADPNARWAHWDAEVTPLHLAAVGGNPDVVRLLLQAGADPALRDSKHDGDAAGWAEHFERPELVAMLESHRGPAGRTESPDTA
jgi:ankyrin repeat protein